jgi:hypothetical protein
MPGRPLYLGEGWRDVGAPEPGRRVVPCDFEGDLPRLMRRLAEVLGVETRFGYDASTFRDVVARAGVRDGIPNPKHLWATYSGRSHHREGVSLEHHRDEQRRLAWQALRPDVVGHLCPRGFAPFDADAKVALRQLLG